MPLVVVGPYEHHSNLLPWRESGCLVVAVEEAAGGGVDMDGLDRVLRQHADNPLKIGTFSAASNLTGILCDTIAISVALHRHKALAFFDYATAGPYTSINMNPVVTQGSIAGLAYKDAVFLSPHKFVGGVATPGVLAFKKDILQSGVEFGAGAPPALPGGGTVFFVTDEDHRYLGNLEEREEAGTPDIIGAIRCGLVMRLKESVGVPAIMQREETYWHMAKQAWAGNSNIHMLGAVDAHRLPIVAFNIRKGTHYLHHNFVAAVLNDVFGIQVRAGCSCAGPYAQKLLGIDYRLAKLYEAALLQGDEAIRPGLVRLNLNYFLPLHVVEFIIRAVSFVADEGWKLLPLYTFIPASGEWRHRADRKFALRHRRWLSDVRFESGQMIVRPIHSQTHEALNDTMPHGGVLSDPLVESYMHFAQAQASAVQEAVSAGKSLGAANLTENHLAAETMALQSPEAALLRWFMLPSEAVALLKGKALPDRLCAMLQGMPLPCVPHSAMEQQPGSEGVNADGSTQKGVVSGFEVFARAQQETLLQRQPHASFQEVLQVAGEAWRSLSPTQRLAFSTSGSSSTTTLGIPTARHNSRPHTNSHSSTTSTHTNATSAQPPAQHGAANANIHIVTPEPPPQKTGRLASLVTEGKQGKAKGKGGERGEKVGEGATGIVCTLKGRCVEEEQEDAAARKKRGDKTQKKLMSHVGKAVLDFGMIKDGDRIMVRLRIYMYVYVNVNMCVYMYMYICTCKYV